MTSRAVILARGLGSRMRRAADADVALSDAQSAAATAGHKAMMPVGRPLIEHLLTAVADAGLREAVLVIGPEHADIRAHFAAELLAAPRRRLVVRFAEQAEPRGTADAVLAARGACGDAPFVVLNGDTWYPPEAIAAVAQAPAPAFGAFDAEALVRLSNIPAERVMAFALCDVAPDGALRDLVEKPAVDHPLALAARRVVSMNLWHFGPTVFEALAKVTPSPRGELELVDAVRELLRSGARVAAVPLALGVLDLSTRGDVASVERALGGRRVQW